MARSLECHSSDAIDIFRRGLAVLPASGVIAWDNFSAGVAVAHKVPYTSYTN
jgi:hypothetical protein